MRSPLLSRPSVNAPLWRSEGEVLAEAGEVYVRLGGRDVLAGANISISAGTMTALVGPNGAGKSTLLGVLAGDLNARSGSVSVLGRPVDNWTTSELALVRTLLPQQPSVNFGFSVESVVRMARAPWSRTAESAADDEIVGSAMADADVTAFASRRFPSLSGGEKARASLARVLAQQTQILLLDEPTASLDVHHTEMVFSALRRRVSKGAGIVVVLHDLQLAAAHADIVVLLADGSVSAEGPPKAVFTTETLSRVYGHDIDVLAYPETGMPLVVPRRRRTMDGPGKAGAQHISTQKEQFPVQRKGEIV